YARWLRLTTSEDQMLPSASGRVTFFVQSNKESNQRKCFFLFSNQEPLSFGACAGMRHTGHPWPGWRTAHILCAALRVYDCLWRVRGGGGSEEQQQRQQQRQQQQQQQRGLGGSRATKKKAAHLRGFFLA
uniref:hypothetical protein n=1 Tax=Streptomyces avermitilis TaxID=33903 RepID=UPI00383A28BF